MYRDAGRTYTGLWPAAPGAGGMQGWGAPAGHCRQCGQPSGRCSCGCKQCRTESKELVVVAQARQGGDNQPGVSQPALNPLLSGMIQSAAQAKLGDAQSDLMAAANAVGSGAGFIGGGCCVSISVEYMPSSPTVVSAVLILVQDSDGTTLAWMRIEQPGSGYHVKECVITTNPGAKLQVAVINATARVRWCEIFSC